MRPRYYRRGQTIHTDEVGTFTTRCQRSGWYITENHYGNHRVLSFPGGFWWGLWRYRIRGCNVDWH